MHVQSTLKKTGNAKTSKANLIANVENNVEKQNVELFYKTKFSQCGWARFANRIVNITIVGKQTIKIQFHIICDEFNDGIYSPVYVLFVMVKSEL